MFHTLCIRNGVYWSPPVYKSLIAFQSTDLDRLLLCPGHARRQRDWPGPSQGRVSSMRVDSSAGSHQSTPTHKKSDRWLKTS